ncbi:MAG: AMP-binding protein, partial [Gemmatimonadaceae bacterium]|nr:AMP-binding protein [Gemmatimonadaceae bacterium]
MVGRPRFMRFARERGALGVIAYPSLWKWSVEHPEELWPAVWKCLSVIADQREVGDPWDEVVVGLERMAPPDPDIGPRWFTGARLNFAENLLRFRGPEAAIIAWNERGKYASHSFDELRAEVARVAKAMRDMGIVAGDRVAGYMPNVPETVVARLGAASIGALWSSCSPDFGVKGVLDRFGQIEPKLLFCADGYRYAGKEIDCLERVKEIVDGLPTLERVVVLPY